MTTPHDTTTTFETTTTLTSTWALVLHPPGVSDDPATNRVTTGNEVARVVCWWLELPRPWWALQPTWAQPAPAPTTWPTACPAADLVQAAGEASTWWAALPGVVLLCSPTFEAPEDDDDYHPAVYGNRADEPRLLGKAAGGLARLASRLDPTMLATLVWCPPPGSDDTTDVVALAQAAGVRLSAGWPDDTGQPGEAWGYPDEPQRVESHLVVL